MTIVRLLACAAALAATAASAQQPASGYSKPPDAPPAANNAAGGQSAEAAAAGKADEGQKKAERLQKIQQLTFDRRPSAIFGVWSAPAKKAAEPATSEKPADGAAAAPPDPFDAELADFQRNVTLGDWQKVKAFLAGLPEEEGKAAYKALLQALQTAPGGLPPDLPPQVAAMVSQMQSMNPQMAQLVEQNAFTFDDMVGLAAAAPRGLENEHLTALGGVVRQAIQAGHVLESLVARLKAEAALPEPAISRRQAARLLAGAGYALQAGEFLPDLEQAQRDSDHEALNLLSQHFLAAYEKDPKGDGLQRAWLATQAVLASGEIKQAEKDEALKRAVELAPKVREDLGQTWLEESFTSRPERGMEIVAAIGSAASQGRQLQPNDPEGRLKGLQLQTTAVEALLKSSPELAGQWRSALDLLAGNWLVEAEYSHQNDQSTSSQPGLRRDPYGNYFYYDETQYYGMRQPLQVQPVVTGELLKIKPSQAWMDMLTEGLRPKLAAVYAQLYLKVSEDDHAYPYIEQLARSHPDRAKELVDEFLRVWTDNHDPNAARRRTNFYMFSYGYERRAEGIPLTRSKQERNLAELARLVQRLKELPLPSLNEELLAKAFTTCHSSAEVYRLDAIEKVFGPVKQIKPKTLAELAQQMRGNLAGLWREPAVQEQNKTKRKQKDIEAEVLRGYGVARRVVAGALKKYPNDWSLRLAEACLEHDENAFRRELAPNSEFSERRGDAFAGFERAAKLYAAEVGKLPKEEESTRVYEHWFYASLGACDLEQVSDETQPDLRQPPKIRQAILALPGDAAERHLGMFANTLFTRMSAAKPAVKFRYVREGFVIAGDHKLAHEARKVHDYYQDLVSEIKLEAAIDGSDVVGHKEPFGVFVNLRHTREIERESGGFGRYLQNQSSMAFSYNYGRPTEDYRDKFQEAVKQALEERFEVLSVTFQTENVNSRAVAGQYGWRYTPYAYLLLRARGPEVDQIPPLRLDLDFLDTSGYVILPVETAAVPIDARPEKAEPRPAEKLEIVQTLDERQAQEGRLVLEVKATGQGLVPRLDELLDVKPGTFVVRGIDDLGVSVSKFDPDSPRNAVLSERVWTINLAARDDLAERPTTFRFAPALRDDAKLTYQRYVDADLADVPQTISLEERYGAPRRWWPWAAGGLLAALVLAAWTARRLARRHVAAPRPKFQAPDNATPFNVLGLLKAIDREHDFGEAERQELHRSIDRIEAIYFASNGEAAPDLAATAADWVRKTEQNGAARNGQ